MLARHTQTVSAAGAGRNLQGTHAKHHADANLSSPVQLQGLELPHRDGEHPDVRGNAHAGVGPAEGVDVHAAAGVGAVPFSPKVADWRALKYSQKTIDGAPNGYKGHGAPEQPTHRPAGEDAVVEEEQRELQGGDLLKIEHLDDIEAKSEFRDLVWRQRPDVAAHAVLRQPGGVEDGGRHAADDGDEAEPVIPAKVETSPELVGEPLDHEKRRDDAERIRHDRILAASVADRRVARFVGDVLDRCAHTSQIQPLLA